jgi:hypothetical protein
MKRAGLCVGGPYGGQHYEHELGCWPVYKPLFPTMRDMSIAAKVLPDVEMSSAVITGHYQWDDKAAVGDGSRSYEASGASLTGRGSLA